ncbi:MAG: glycosyltransferase family 2 protein [Acidobacteriota bacterium]
MAARVSFIIVNYNGEKFIEKCLDSVWRQSQCPHQVIVVDNASPDRSVEVIRTTFPAVNLIALDDNLGYAGGCNRGMEEASGDLIAILNNDVVLDLKWLELLIEHDLPPWDFWACRILFALEPDRIDSAGDGMAVVGSAFKLGHGDRAENHQTGREVFGPCAAAALYRRSLLVALGGFDPDFFLIYEDADLNMRARLRGHRCLYVPDAIVYHHVNASIRTFSHNYVYFGHRNSEYVFWKNMPTPLLLLYLPERLIFNLLSFFFFMGKGRSVAFLQGKWDFVRKLPLILGKRRAIQQTRTLNCRQFRRFLHRNWFIYRRKAMISP